MFDGRRIGRRLGWFGAAWLAGFLLAFAAALLLPLVSERTLVQAVDLVLPVLLGATGVGLLAGTLSIWITPAKLPSKIFVTVLGAALALPLLWAPVCGAVAAAWASGAVIEYSAAYRDFRIVVGTLLYDVAGLFVRNPVTAALWSAFEVLSTVIGVLAGILRLMPAARGLFGAEAADAG